MLYSEEINKLSTIATSLLQELEPETEYVKDYIKRECEKLENEKWTKTSGEQPWMQKFEKEGYTLRIAFIHARKGEHITGADLFFELKNKKFILIQSKRVGRLGRINFNRFQLQKLLELEWQLNGYGSLHGFYVRKPTLFLSPQHSLFIFSGMLKTTFYHLIMASDDSSEEKFFHTSEIEFTLGARKSVSQKEFLGMGLKEEDFRKLFWECKIGAPDLDESYKQEVLHLYSLITNRFIIWLDVEER